MVDVLGSGGDVDGYRGARRLVVHMVSWADPLLGYAVQRVVGVY